MRKISVLILALSMSGPAISIEHCQKVINAETGLVEHGVYIVKDGFRVCVTRSDLKQSI